MNAPRTIGAISCALVIGAAMGAGGYYLATRGDVYALRARADAVAVDLRETQSALGIAIRQADGLAVELEDARIRIESAEARAGRLEIDNRAIIDAINDAQGDASGIGNSVVELVNILRRVQERGSKND